MCTVQKKNRGPWLEVLVEGEDDLPRAHEPVDVFYLPFNENWPVNLYEHFIPSYWADEAFTEGYARALSRAFAAFARHVNEQQWDQPVFQFYLNNKISYPQFSRDLLWGVTNIEYYGGSTGQRIRFAENRKLLHGPFSFAEYGSANRIDGPNTDIVDWCMDAWFRGAALEHHRIC
jgi:hypothetical protein